MARGARSWFVEQTPLESLLGFEQTWGFLGEDPGLVWESLLSGSEKQHSYGTDSSGLGV